MPPPGAGNGVLAGPPAVRAIGAVNWRGLWTLYRREVTRFYKVGTDDAIGRLGSQGFEL